MKGREGGRRAVAAAEAVWFNGAREGRLESLGADGDEQMEREEGDRGTDREGEEAAARVFALNPVS